MTKREKRERDTQETSDARVQKKLKCNQGSELETQNSVMEKLI